MRTNISLSYIIYAALRSRIRDVPGSKRVKERERKDCARCFFSLSPVVSLSLVIHLSHSKNSIDSIACILAVVYPALPTFRTFWWMPLNWTFFFALSMCVCACVRFDWHCFQTTKRTRKRERERKGEGEGERGLDMARSNREEMAKKEKGSIVTVPLGQSGRSKSKKRKVQTRSLPCVVKYATWKFELASELEPLAWLPTGPLYYVSTHANQAIHLNSKWWANVKGITFFRFSLSLSLSLFSTFVSVPFSPCALPARDFNFKLILGMKLKL